MRTHKCRYKIQSNIPTGDEGEARGEEGAFSPRTSFTEGIITRNIFFTFFKGQIQKFFYDYSVPTITSYNTTISSQVVKFHFLIVLCQL